MEQADKSGAAAVRAVDAAAASAVQHHCGAVRKAVLELARAAGAPERELPVWPGARSTITHAEPMWVIRAAVIVRRAASEIVDEYVREARGEGIGWEPIGQALGLEEEAQESDRPLGEVAYESVVGPPGHCFDEPKFHYTCGSCGGRVTDSGPYNGHPIDEERGHGKTCQRFAAALAEYERDNAGY
jgi:hypothetical protein